MDSDETGTMLQYQADNDYSNKLNSLTRDISNRGDAFKELGFLQRSAYTFQYPSVRVMIEEIHEALAEKNESTSEATQVYLTFVNTSAKSKRLSFKSMPMTIGSI